MTLENVAAMIKMVEDDPLVPKNIKKAMAEARQKIESGEGGDDVRASAALYIIEPISNEVNIPVHTRTQIWNIISMLETVK